MLSFFTILLILVGANVLFMAFSLSGISNTDKKSEANPAESGVSITRIKKSLKTKFKKAA
ncbi:MAG: hypothetical protein WBG48_00300 [Pricia sp.]